MAIEVYADQYGIGIYDQSWREDPETNHFCSDLRLDDVRAFLKFMYEMMVMAADLGWLPVDVVSR